MRQPVTTPPNQPAAGNTALALRLRIGHHWRDVPI